MNRLLITILLFISAYSLNAQLLITDNGLKTCLSSSYPSLLLNDSTLNITATNSYTQNIECKDHRITDLSAIVEFKSIWSLVLDSVEATDVSPLLGLSSIEQLIISRSTIKKLPDLSTLTKLNYLEVQNCGLESFPELPDSIDKVQLANNNITSVSLTKNFPELISLQLMKCQISSITGLNNAPNLVKLFLGGNQLTQIEDLSSLVNLETLQLFGNNLSVIPGLISLNKLKVLHASGNKLQDLPEVDVSKIEKLYIGFNQLTFEDLLPLQQSAFFPDSFPSYNLQNEQGKELSVELNEGELWEFKLDFDETVMTNYYLWYLNDVLIDSSSDNSFVIPITSMADVGTYTCVVKNTSLPNTSIKVKPIILNILSSVNRTESAAFSPNGDGNNDTYYLKETGYAKIYTERGKLVNELETPFHWDGTDYTGAPLPFGYYIISVNGTDRYGVTIVK